MCTGRFAAYPVGHDAGGWMIPFSSLCVGTLLMLLLDLGLRRHERARVLVCGDADFAYSRALATALDDTAQIWTSCFETEADLQQRYEHATEAVSALRRDDRVDVRCGVDARALPEQCGPSAAFDRVVFNLPQAPSLQGSRNKIQRHRALLRDFCASAATMLSEDGEVWVTLLAGQGGTALDPLPRPLGDTWQLQHAAARAGLLVRAAHEVKPEALGYVPTGRRVAQRLTPRRLARGLVVHVLSREGNPPTPAACGPLEWRFDDTFHSDAHAAAGRLDGDALLEHARAALGPALAHCLVSPPELLRTRTLDSLAGGAAATALTLRVTLRSDRLALPRERAVRLNAAACDAIAAAAGVHWRGGYPVLPRDPDEP